MGNRYWVTEVTWRVSGVPDDVQELGIGARCTVCELGHVMDITWNDVQDPLRHKTFQCQEYSPSITINRHKIPKVYLVVDGNVLRVVDGDSTVEYPAVIHRVG